ncbi:glycosyltransferase [Lacticaseibacillus paracasei subsp. tolerans DSM 20258]|nr:glycosyltransferase [Lacticaseibacillus paracasei subsp. tolerans DSM 20258]MCT3362971.1 glycosyltransferase family 1 protein [Lacticaseibacillus paracasei]GEL38639.1 glycosyltransferase family 1 (GT1) [Lacticaseibacillus paracasei subsp. tolerans]
MESRILVGIGHLKRGAGITELVLKFYTALSQKYGYQIEFIVDTKLPNVVLPEVPENIKIIYAPLLKKSPIKYLQFWKRVSDNADQYVAIHFHIDSLTKFIPLFLLRKRKNVIIHSHNSMNLRISENKLKTMAHEIGKQIVRKGKFIKFACSDTAATWLFDNSQYFQVNNGINLESFRFNYKVRDQIRKKLDIGNSHLYGHIGRFQYPKNQIRVVEIFSEIVKMQSNSKLVFIGDGPDEDIVRRRVRELSLTTQVIFAGYQENVPEYLNAIDEIIFPSFYEGLPISLVEAQANGVPVLYSDRITNEIDLLISSRSFSLNDDDLKIAHAAVSAISKNGSRDNAVAVLENAGYSLDTVIADLNSFYQQMGHSKDFSGKSIYGVTP